MCSLLRCTAVAIAVVALAAPASGDGDAAGAHEAVQVHENEKYGYSISYPGHWAPSGIVYANAFEIRNYGPAAPDVPERNWASVIAVDTVNETAEVSRRFVASHLIGGASVRDGAQPLDVEGYKGVRIHGRRPAQSLAPATLRALGLDPEEGGEYLTVSTYIAHGKHLLSIEGVAQANADEQVIEEIKRIHASISFGHEADDAPEEEESSR